MCHRKTFKYLSFFFLKSHFKFVESVNYFATSICTCVIQVIISTGILTFFVQVYISKLRQVHYSYLYLLKKKTNI